MDGRRQSPFGVLGTLRLLDAPPASGGHLSGEVVLSPFKLSLTFTVRVHDARPDPASRAAADSGRARG